MTHHTFLAAFALTLLNLSLLSSGAFADEVDCAKLPSVRWEHVRDIRGSTERGLYTFGKEKVVEVERCRTFGGHAYWQERYNVSVWQEGKLLVKQTIFGGMTTGSRYTIDAKRQRVTIAFHCGDIYSDKDSEAKKMCRTTWSWDKQIDALINKDTIPAYKTTHLLALKKHLNEKNDQGVLQAIQHLEYRIPPVWNLAWYAIKTQSALEMLHSRALLAHKTKKPDQAATQSLKALDKIHQHTKPLFPALSPPLEPSNSRGLFLLQWKGAPMHLLLNSESATMVNDLAFFLAQSKTPKNLLLAIDLYTQVESYFPKRQVTALNLADAWWELGQIQGKDHPQWRAKAHRAYSTYLASTPKTKRSAQLKARVERLSK